MWTLVCLSVVVAMASLSKTEFDALVVLLARAHYAGDAGMLETHVAAAYDGLVKQSGPPVEQTPGAMTDGSKRRLTADGSPSVDDSPPIDGFEFVEDVDALLAHKLELDMIRDELDPVESTNVAHVPIGQYGAAQEALHHGGIHAVVPLPKGVSGDAEWSATLCELPAMASPQMSYEQVREKARKGDTKIRGYLNWLCSTYGESGVKQLQMVGCCRSQGFDMAAWLRRQCWHICESKVQTFDRKFVGAKPKTKAGGGSKSSAGSWSRHGSQ